MKTFFFFLEIQACYSLGNTYTLLRDYQEAVEYHSKHLEIAQELGDRYAVHFFKMDNYLSHLNHLLLFFNLRFKSRIAENKSLLTERIINTPFA